LNYGKNILTIILLTVFAQTVFGTTWSAAYPYKQRINGQDVVIKAYPYDPYSGSPMIGVTKVYLKKKLLYTIDKYYREGIFTSDDGQYLAVINTSNSAGVSSYTSFGMERINFNQTAIEVFKNGLPFKTFSLKDVIDTTKLANNGQFFNWGYSLDFDAFQNAEFSYESCLEVYGRRVIRTGDTTEIYPDELKECRNACDSVRLKEVELGICKNSMYVKENSLYVLTNQNTVVVLDFADMSIKQIPFDKIIPDKEHFYPPKNNRKYKKIKLPDKFVEPNLKDGSSFENGIAELFNLSIPDNQEKETFCVFINYLVIDKDGLCIDFYGKVHDERISEFFIKESINQEMTEKLEEWIKEQVFDTKLIPKKFDAYSFLCIVNLK
jgi:hypothetical protein